MAGPWAGPWLALGLALAGPGTSQGPSVDHAFCGCKEFTKRLIWSQREIVGSREIMCYIASFGQLVQQRGPQQKGKIDLSVFFVVFQVLFGVLEGPGGSRDVLLTIFHPGKSIFHQKSIFEKSKVL